MRENKLFYNPDVIESVEQKEDGWICLKFKPPHPIPSEVKPE